MVKTELRPTMDLTIKKDYLLRLIKDESAFCTQDQFIPFTEEYALTINHSDWEAGKIQMNELKKILKKLKEEKIIGNYEIIRDDHEDPPVIFIPEINIYVSKDQISLINELSVKTETGSLEFNELNGVLRFGDKTHTFQKQQKNRLLIFRKLWPLRKITRNGKDDKKGDALPPETLAVQIEMIREARDYKIPKIKNKMSNLLKAVNRTLKEKRFPATIKQRGGIQLIVTIK